jgi:hypothetical protein
MARIGVASTRFTLDVLGRYTCNTEQEVLDGLSRPDARPFDLIVVGGGSFGPIFAANAFFDDLTHSRRILVLDAGPMVLPEHQQNLPVLGEVFALVRQRPWQSDDAQMKFAGLAMMIGGRSVFFGGWSPQLLDNAQHTEMPSSHWPAAVVTELKSIYFPQASSQLAVDETNDFIFGPLHEALRKRLADGIDAGDIDDAIPIDDLELHIKVPDGTPAAETRLWKLEAPLAVQSSATRSGFFPFNKFSSVPLVVRSAREAQFEVEKLLNDRTDLGESPEREGDDAKKRYMIVPRVLVTKLDTSPSSGGSVRVTAVLGKKIESDGSQTDVSIPVAEGAQVIVALGTIESTRLVLNSFSTIPGSAQVGKNFMAHLRSNIVMRIPRSSLPVGLPQELQASALLLKGAHTFADGTNGYFHLQITAAGLDNLTQDDHVELFMKVPDIDFFEDIAQADDQHVVITIRGIGEMQPDNNLSFVEQVAGSGNPAQVRAHLELSPKDVALWDAMDRASDQAAKVFANGDDFEVQLPGNKWQAVTPASDLELILKYRFRDEPVNPGRRDRLGTTHHEAGTLRIGTNGSTSVSDANCKIRGVENAYVAGPALFPTIGSPNPMLTGTALARRLATHLLATMPKHLPTASPGFSLLFDGQSLGDWKMSTIRDEPGQNNPGRFIVVDGALEATPGTGLGLLWYAKPTPADYVLRLQWNRFRHDGNSGVLLRFPDPRSKGYRNTAYVASHFGYEVQIDELGAPDGALKHRTGAIYAEDSQTFSLQPALPAGQWNEYEIRVQGNQFTVKLNGAQVTHFVNLDPNRGQPTTPSAPAYLGLQCHFASRVAFRNIEILAI